MGWIVGVRKMTAEAIPAMHRASPRGDQERPPVVFLNQTRPASGGDIPDRIGRKVWWIHSFRMNWQHLPQQRIVRVSRLHSRQETARDEQRKLSRRLLGRFAERGGQTQQGKQFFWIADRLGQRLEIGGAIGSRGGVGKRGGQSTDLARGRPPGRGVFSLEGLCYIGNADAMRRRERIAAGNVSVLALCLHRLQLRTAYPCPR